MLTVQEAVQSIRKITQQIHEQAQLAKVNKVQCQYVAANVATIEKAIGHLEKLENKDTYQVGLNSLYEILQKIFRVVKKFSEKRWLVVLLKTGTYSNQFHALNQKLLTCVLSLNVGLSAQQLSDATQEKEAQREDQLFLKANLNNIVQLQQQIAPSLQSLSLEQEDKKALESQQLASLQLQVSRLESNQFIAPKPLIDPRYEMAFFELAIEKVLGEGSLGKVYLGRWNEQPVAIKMLEGDFTEDEKAEFIREVKIMSALRNKNITQFYGACLEPQRACLVMEHMEQGSLATLLTQAKLAPEQQKNMALQIARGLAYLHKQQVIHRDLKSSNILINENGEAKITNFGLAKTKSTSVKTIKKRSQALQWLAPECLEVGEHHTKEADIYSFGVILWELLTGKRPYANFTANALIEHLRAGNREILPAHLPPIYGQIIQQCWEADPGKRPPLGSLIYQLEAFQPASVGVNEAAAEKNYQLGTACQEKKEDASAFTYYELAAQENHTKAKTNLGLLLLKGFKNAQGNFIQDKVKAHYYFLGAAKQGHGRAMLNLAIMLEKGDGIEQDLDQALFWYTRPELKDTKKARERAQNLQHPSPIFLAPLNSLTYQLKSTDAVPQKKAVAPRQVLPTREQGRTIVGNEYALISRVNRKEANELLEQEGIEISFENNETTAPVIIGRGNYGKLRLAKKLSSNEYVAVKKVKGEVALAASEKEDFFQAELSELSHILPLLGSVLIQDKKGRPTLYQFMRLAGFGNGLKFQQQCSYLTPDQQLLKERLFVQVAHDILTGIAQMNQLGIYHLDFKPANLVLFMRGEANIIDFGCAERPDNSGRIQGGNGDTKYFPPERFEFYRQQEKTNSIIKGKDGKKFDAWAVGLTLLEMWLNDYPFDKCGIAHKFENWDAAYFENKLQNIAWLCEAKRGSFASLVATLLVADPYERLSCEKALKHSIFKDSHYRFASTFERHQAFQGLYNLKNPSPEESKPDSKNYEITPHTIQAQEDYIYGYYNNLSNQNINKYVLARWARTESLSTLPLLPHPNPSSSRPVYESKQEETRVEDFKITRGKW